MTHDEDEQLTQFLQRNAPPSRDPLFRVKVLERRERQWFRRRVSLLGIVLAVAAISAVGVSVGGKLNEVARVVGALVAVTMAVTVYAPILMRLLRRYTSVGLASSKRRHRDASAHRKGRRRPGA